MIGRALCRLTAVVALLLAVSPGPAAAQQDILLENMAKRVFFVNCSGMINGRLHFENVHHQVIITFTEAGSRNPLEVIITSLPAVGIKNCFYWNAEETVLTAIAGTIHSRLNTRGTRVSDLRFYYMSPALYKDLGPDPETQAETRRLIDAKAKPIPVLAQDAELTLHVSGNTIDGTVRINGMDQEARIPCLYLAHFHGQEFPELQPKK